MIKINFHPNRRELTVFSALLAGVLFAFALGLELRSGNRWIEFALFCAGALVAIGIGFPRQMRWIYVAWMIAAFPLGWLISHVACLLIYWGVVTPVGLLLRLRGYDPLCLRFNADAKTYWRERKPYRGPDQYFRPF